MMDKNSTSLLNLLTAGILAITAQSFLLIPHRQEALLKSLPISTIIALAAFLLIASYLSFSTIFYNRSNRWRQVTSLLSILAIGILAILYARASLFIEASLFVGAGIAQIIATWLAPKDALSYKKILIYLLSLTHLLIGIGLLFFPRFLDIPTYAPILQWKFALSIIFLLTTGLGIYAFFRRSASLNKSLVSLIVLPWLGWTLIFAYSASLPILIPTIFISITPLVSGLLPFKKLTLPRNDIFGHRVLPTLSLIHTLILTLFYLLLNTNISPSAYHELVFIFSISLMAFIAYGVITLHIIIHDLTTGSSTSQNETKLDSRFSKFIELLLGDTRNLLTEEAQWQAKKIQRLSKKLKEEKRNAERFALIDKLRKQLEDQLDEPVAAQLVVNTLQHTFNAGLIAILTYDAEQQDLVVLASAGKMRSSIPTGYRQKISEGALGRAARSRKTQVIHDTRLDNDYFDLQGLTILSEVVVPLLHYGHLRGVLTIGDQKTNALSAADITLLETVAKELVNAWEQTGHNQRLTALIQSSVSLATSLEPQAAIQEIAILAKETLQARFVFATLLDQDGAFTRVSHAGDAPNLLHYLSRDLTNNKLLQTALHTSKPLRIRDVHKHKNSPSIVLDQNTLRNLLIVPIRLHGVNIGAILAFGKQGSIFFSEKDESLANLLSLQAATAIESAWLIHEWRSTVNTMKLLTDLSYDVIQTDTVSEAAQVIAEAARKLAQASAAGIVLYTPQKEIRAALEIDSAGMRTSDTLPMAFIEQTLTTGESITVSIGKSSAQTYLPIQTPLRKYGVLWMDIPEITREIASQSQTLQTLANQAAIALERVLLLIDSRQKAQEIKAAYKELEITYDQTLIALMSALDARDRETEGHSERVGKAAYLLGTKFNLSEAQRDSLQRGSLLHDIGKIGVSDTILNKAGKLTDEEWEIMRQHPTIGRDIIKDIPFLQDAIPVVYAHHERWNGSGYPLGLRGTEIPLEARIFAVADIFDALTSARPYRDSISDQEALAYLQEQAGILVDPDVVAAFERLVNAQKIRGATIPINRKIR